MVGGGGCTWLSANSDVMGGGGCTWLSANSDVVGGGVVSLPIRPTAPDSWQLVAARTESERDGGDARARVCVCV